VINLRRLLRVFITILSLLFALHTSQGQAVIKLRSAISTGGSTKTFSLQGKQYQMQQTIGQSGVIGLSYNSSYLLRQGFIQPLKGSVNTISAETLPLTIFPNPFSGNITISLSETISDFLYVTLFDLNGKIVFLKKYGANQKLNLDVGFLSPAVYILRVNTNTKYYYSKLFKF
jgi:hypothetical protein